MKTAHVCTPPLSNGENTDYRIGRVTFTLRCNERPNPEELQNLNRILARALVDKARRNSAATGE